MSVRSTSDGARGPGNLRKALQDYLQIHHLTESQEAATQIEELPKLVSRYYDAVTRWYEFGWGTNFHFAPRRPGESLLSSQRRQQLEVAEILRLKPGMQVADIGSGVGGPMINIARASGASITGINLNAFQIERGKRRVSQAGLDDTCRFLHANFLDVPLEDETFDAIYAFQATCHAPNKLLLFQELYRLLRGGEMAILDWCLTDRFDANDACHQDLRRRVETDNVTPNLPTLEQQVDALRRAGFEIIHAIDQEAECGNPQTPWYMALQGRDFSLTSWARTPAGRKFSETVTKFLELVRLVPTGTFESAALLNAAANDLVKVGELKIFTPVFLVHVRKPAIAE
ncbi:MAG: methyltransferase domain-containing protein [Chloroflexi bacterium]|nr:methyltransferase domain-containing protein [Chloroflexota bacterium]MCY3696265.1 methyltransferase domain-containing protein [Chloroflexota bacterium]